MIEIVNVQVHHNDPNYTEQNDQKYVTQQDHWAKWTIKRKLETNRLLQ